MSDGDKRERRSHFRGKSRPGRRVALTFTLIEGGGPRQAVTRNIGVGGAYIELADPMDVGTQMIVSIDVPTAGDPIEVKAEVRWTDAEGMGVKFSELDVDQLLQLSEYFASLTGTGIQALDE